MGRLLAMAQDKYQVYLRITANTYMAQSPLGSGQPLGMRVWCWSPYQKKGRSGALSAKWSGPWRIIKFKPLALSLLQSEWLHLKGKPEIQREAVIDKLRPYTGDDPAQKDLEDDKLGLIDGDDEATDPQVDAQEILELMKWISCCVPEPSQRRREIDLIKSEGEGDWGNGPINSQLRVTTTAWSENFQHTGPPVVSDGPGEVEETRVVSSKDRPQPGPSSRPTSVRDLPADTRHPDGRQRNSSLTRGEINKNTSQRPSVPGQTPEGQHPCLEDSSDPTAVGDRTSGPSGHTYRPS